MKVLIIDNYDSFTFNLYQYVGEILMEKEKNFVVDVFRNDEITTEEIKKRNYNRIIISPGPGDAKDKKYFGVCSSVLLDIGKTIPVLGVCLGMQGMAYCFGGKVVRAKAPMHGKTSIISHDGKGILKGLPQGVEVMRYHSLVVDPKSLPACLEVTSIVSNQRGPVRPFLPASARSGASRNDLRAVGNPSRFATPLLNGLEIMGLRHRTYPVEGIQFHPESFATDGGKLILENFLYQNV